MKLRLRNNDIAMNKKYDERVSHFMSGSTRVNTSCEFSGEYVFTSVINGNNEKRPRRRVECHKILSNENRSNFDVGYNLSKTIALENVNIFLKSKRANLEQDKKTLMKLRLEPSMKVL